MSWPFSGSKANFMELDHWYLILFVDYFLFRCLEEGAEDFLLKPVKLADVKRLRDSLLKAYDEIAFKNIMHKRELQANDIYSQLKRAKIWVILFFIFHDMILKAQRFTHKHVMILSAYNFWELNSLFCRWNQWRRRRGRTKSFLWNRSVKFRQKDSLERTDTYFYFSLCAFFWDSLTWKKRSLSLLFWWVFSSLTNGVDSGGFPEAWSMVKVLLLDKLQKNIA